MLHRGAVVSSLLSAAPAHAFNISQHKRIDSSIGKQLRRVFAKKASGFSLVDGQAVYRPIPNTTLFRFAGWPGSEVENRVLRLRFW